MKAIGIIPARYASTRFPGKPLALLGDKTVIEHVYRRAAMALDQVVVATDDARIFDTVAAFGGRAVMTSPDHRSGTDRCYEAYLKSGSDAGVIINIQGDEPFVDPGQIRALAECFNNPATDIATLVRPYDPGEGKELADPNLVKVVTATDDTALYFSRSVIPYARNAAAKPYLTHVGMYGYRNDVLARITSMPQTPLELTESLEQLRWLENGLRIQTALTDIATIGIDTPQDLENAKKMLQ